MIAALFFWPLMIVSIICSILGIVLARFRYLYSSAVMIIPMSLYFAATPRFRIWGLIFPLFYLFSAFLLKRKKPMLALIFCLPIYALIGWLAYVVLTQ